MTDQLINTNPIEKKACVFWGGQLHEFPEGLRHLYADSVGALFS